MKRDDYLSPEQRASIEDFCDKQFWEKFGIDAREGLTQARKRRIVRPVGIWQSDAELCNLGEDRANFMMDWVIDQRGPVTLGQINAILEKLEARPFVYTDELTATPAELERQLQSFVKRIGCNLWWRRQLRRAQVRKREAQAQAAGHICARNMPYVHDVTEVRYTQRQEANRAMLEQTEIESADGEIISLWDAVQASTANKSIRRGELMTRIRGSEEWATERGMVGIFTTNTLPSRFHASLFGGGMNPNFQGSTPRQGQQWLSATWARARAKIQRQGIKVFGFRVAEPHHDGCPHWHMLLWVSPAQAQQLQDLIRACWLQYEGDEHGAQAYRVKFEAIDPARGGAIAYVAKYISKNIDDAGSVGTEGHFDQQGEQRELIEGGNKARRVTAWASAWGIRQFQAIGQPPVTVWRELRRIDAAMAAGGSPRLQRAHAAAHKDGEQRADWKTYMHEQGGAMVGRDYQLRLDLEPEAREGRYGPIEVKLPKGVYDVKRPGETCTSTRKRWLQKGTWTPQERHRATVGDFALVFAESVYFDPTWTRFNNCTPPTKNQRTNDARKARKTQNRMDQSTGHVQNSRGAHGFATPGTPGGHG